MAHPINAFALMKRMSVAWREVLDNGESDGTVRDTLKKLPDERDFAYGAHFGLMAAQNYYDQVAKITRAPFISREKVCPRPRHGRTV